MAVSSLARADAGWVFTLYPLAGEAGGSFVYSKRAPRWWAPGIPAVDPERSRAEAARRARSKVRRFCAEHRLNRLGTLTYAGAGCHDPVQLRLDVAAFFRRLRSLLGGQPLPYVWVPEWHPGGHGLHVHFAVGRFVPRGLIDEAWGRGFVHIKRLSGLPVGSGPWEEARLAARYLSKYVSKSFDYSGSLRQGLHRYEVAQGFQPKSIRIDGASAAELIATVCRVMGAEPRHFWSSASVEDWQAPPSLWMAWA